MFMEMVWKAHTKVSIGYHEVSPADADLSSYVVFWVCPGRNPKDFKTHRKAGTAANTFVAN
jgi:hypothetical protein